MFRLSASATACTCITGTIVHKQALLPFLMPGRSCRSGSCLLKFKNTRNDQPLYPVNDKSTGDLRLGCLVEFRPTCRTISAMSSEQDEELIVNCIAILLRRRDGRGQFYRKKNKFSCKVEKSEKRRVKLRETIWQQRTLLLE